METKLLTIKKLENGKYFVDGSSYFFSFIFCFILIFPFVFFSSKNFILSFLCAIVLWGIVSICILINDYFGKKVHHKIFEKEIFRNLFLRGFTKENIDKYEGLLGVKDGRTVRVFYNWNKTTEGFLSFGDIEINIYYKPQIIENDLEKVDVTKLKLLNKKYDKPLRNNNTKRTMFTYHNLKICFNYYPWTKSEKIEKEIKRGLQILKENNFEEVNIKKISNPELRKLELEGFFYPNMQYIWEFQEKNCR